MTRSRFRALLIAGTCLAGTIPAQAQSLMAALEQAYASNPTLNAQRAAARAFDETVPQALAGYRPTVSATANLAVGSLSTKVSGASTTSQSLVPNGVGLQVNQTLFDGLRTAGSVAAAEAGVLGQRETLRGVEQTVLLDAATAYMNVFRDTAMLELRRDNLAYLTEQTKETRQRFVAGDQTQTDVSQAEANAASARSQLLAAQAQLKASIAVYHQVIGSQPSRVEPASFVEALLPHSLAEASRQGIAAQPSVLSAQHAVDVAAADVEVAESALYPTVTAQGSASRQHDYVTSGTLYNRLTSASLGLSASVPVYSGGVDYAKIRQAKEVLAQRHAELDEAREQARADIATAWATFGATAASIDAAKAEVDAAELALQGVSTEQRVGQRTTLDVLNQRQTLVDARSSLISAQRDRIVAAFTLLADIGSLNARALKLAVTPYDPAVHDRQVRSKWAGQ
ncbi:TolC family outer membrane protein [Labrys wisconsinensis]|uniref:Outer membrane protein n=1 Tax=Labrys wisconsinensis TaxID=425677 RepID=A0ABU0JBC9_9HYPH|nr:TolC family outer membrane protein [Labrys wisconsinensis]MDQ0471578.1 outer membrane protein [Labrys wisconsinensis]